MPTPEYGTGRVLVCRERVDLFGQEQNQTRRVESRSAQQRRSKVLRWTVVRNAQWLPKEWEVLVFAGTTLLATSNCCT